MSGRSGAEQLAQPHLAHGPSPASRSRGLRGTRSRRDRAVRKRAPHRGDALALLDQLDLGPAQLLPAAAYSSLSFNRVYCMTLLGRDVTRQLCSRSTFAA